MSVQDSPFTFRRDASSGRHADDVGVEVLERAGAKLSRTVGAKGPGLSIVPGDAGVRIEVNGRPVEYRRSLRRGDRIRIGEQLFTVDDGGGSLPPPPVVPARPRRMPRAPSVFYPAELRRQDGRRLSAFCIDLFVAVVLAVPAGFAFGWGQDWLLPTVILGQLVYFFASETLTGRTVGKRVMDMKVVRADGEPLGPRAVAVRTLLRVVDCVIAMLPMSLTPRRQRLGDVLAGTVVVPADFSAPEPSGLPLRLAVGYPALAVVAVPVLLAVPGSDAAPGQDYRKQANAICASLDDRRRSVYQLAYLDLVQANSELAALQPGPADRDDHEKMLKLRLSFQRTVHRAVDRANRADRPERAWRQGVARLGELEGRQAERLRRLGYPGCAA